MVPTKAAIGSIEQFQPGVLIEFLSGDGRWKPGLVVPANTTFFPGLGKKKCSHPRYIRIWVGNDVHIIRPAKKCRRMDVKLPIDVVPGSNPPRFTWRQTVFALGGSTTQENEGTLQPSVEDAVVGLITMTKRLLMENVMLRGQVATAAERIAAQSELLSKKTESPPLANAIKRGK